MKNIFLNWKQNGNYSTILSFLTDVKRNPNFNIVLFVPFPYLFFANGKIAIGAQNVSSFKGGSYTGEVGASMLLEAGAKYCLVGHSERRMLFGETDLQIKQKLELLKQSGIIPVLCVGENLKDRKGKLHLEVVKKQMENYEDGIMVAYEPVWSIGTGLIPVQEEILEMASFIKENYNKEILYGGSVNEENAKNILDIKNINGVLIGNASLYAEKINKIIS